MLNLILYGKLVERKKVGDKDEKGFIPASVRQTKHESSGNDCNFSIFEAFARKKQENQKTDC